MKPTHHKVTWHVYTTNDLHRGVPGTQPSWAWVVHGPRGSETGVEKTADMAVGKAYAASMLVTDEVVA